MLCLRQIRLIQEHWETIARRALERIRAGIPGSHQLTDEAIADRVRDLLGNLADWLSMPDTEQLAARYEHLGRLRAEEGVRLYEMVRALQLIRQSAVDYMMDHDVGEGPLLAHAESEFEYRMASFFDLAIYHFARGFELELRASIAEPGEHSRAHRLKKLLHA